jgi:hypothetical protein
MTDLLFRARSAADGVRALAPGAAQVIVDLLAYLDRQESEYPKMRQDRDKWRDKYQSAVEFFADVRRRQRGGGS